VIVIGYFLREREKKMCRLADVKLLPSSRRGREGESVRTIFLATLASQSYRVASIGRISPSNFVIFVEFRVRTSAEYVTSGRVVKISIRFLYKLKDIVILSAVINRSLSLRSFAIERNMARCGEFPREAAAA